jgi:hypothetical protein
MGQQKRAVHCVLKGLGKNLEEVLHVLYPWPIILHILGSKYWILMELLRLLAKKVDRSQRGCVRVKHYLMDS